MLRATAILLSTAMLFLGAAAAPAATLLYLASEPGDPVLDGGQSLVTAEIADFYPGPGSFASGVLFNIYERGGDAVWVVRMEAPDGTVLVPRLYDSASGAFTGTSMYPPGAHLEVYGPGGCTGESYREVASSGRFRVRRIVVVGFTLVEFAADFEQRCTGATGTLRGTILYQSGAVACFNQPDGTPCEDLDPCTADDTCRAGACSGSDGVTPTCSAPDGCHDAGVCDRGTGACAPPVRPDGSACEDGSACTTEDRCVDGACVSGAPPDCDDGSICTVDRCDERLGCVHDPAPGECWVFRPVLGIAASATGPGGSARCSLRCISPDPVTLLLEPDETYRVAGSPYTACPSGVAVTVPDEIGTVRTRRGRMVLRPSNLDELVAAFRRCIGGRVPRLRGYRHWIRHTDAGLAGRATVRGHTRIEGIPVSITVNERFSAIPGLDPAGRPVTDPPAETLLPACSTELTPRCARY